ncbi:DUF305 domain-containing protein [Sphingomonas kaistensis]|uniref:DUF305 domain-containing protein n=2 Tax=Sphingomonas kaistensis TaxID=298708 RepID=A0ABZ2G013_9SPHN
MQQGHEHHQTSGNKMDDAAMMRSHYKMLALNLTISLAIMYFVMFAMINSLGEFIQNVNFFYMALMMWAPMGSLMLLMMSGMYKNKRLNMALHAIFVAVFMLSFLATRQQWLVGDKQFLRSMIPHHSGAILMCRESTIRDAEIKRLCAEIIPAQQREIDEMKQIMARM